LAKKKQVFDIHSFRPKCTNSQLLPHIWTSEENEGTFVFCAFLGFSLSLTSLLLLKKIHRPDIEHVCNGGTALRNFEKEGKEKRMIEHQQYHKNTRTVKVEDVY
jgi:hypothetical protein